MPKIPLFLYHEQWIRFNDEPKLVPWHIDVGNEITPDKVRILIKAIEVDIPEVSLLEEAEVKQAIVTGLHQQKKDIQAECQVKLNQIDDTIQQMLAITYNPTSTQE